MKSFDPFPVLQTRRLVLRRVVWDDFNALYAIQSEPTVVRYLGRAPLARAEAEERFFDVEASIEANQVIRWGILDRSTGEFLGTSSFWRWEKKHFRAEIGYELAPSEWGRGLMTEALRAVMAFGFESMDLHRVDANVDPENVGSLRVLQKLGFVREGILREHWYYDGRFTDTVTLGLLRGDFARAALQ